MPKKKYYYDPKTLRFEVRKISFGKILSAGFGYIAFGVLFFCGLLWLQNYIIVTPLEKELKAENSALKTHKEIISGRIEDANSVLTELRTQDNDLYKKIFEIPRTEEVKRSEGKEQILVASAPVFASWTESLTNQFEVLAKRAEASNTFFKLTASVSRSDWNRLQSTPSLQPVENFDPSQLVSGFGIRINPFHKGRYHHDGVDVAAPRGASVVAAGPGKVILVKHSPMLAGFGNYIEIDHGYGYVTRYAHLDEIHVRLGQKVLKGFKIGTVGTTGGAIAPHIHYEVTLNGANVDPIQYMVQGLDSDGYAKLFIASRKINQSLD